MQTNKLTDMKKTLVIIISLTFFLTNRIQAQSCGTTNIALSKSVTVTSEVAFHLGSAAVDGNGSTSWECNTDDSERIYVDLGSSYSICQVVLTWSSNGRAANFKVQTSTDATN